MTNQPSKKPRVFFLTYYPPTPTMGGAMAFHRHFVERDDFEIFVATDDPRLLNYNPKFPVLLFRQPRWLDRLMRTRLFRWAHSYKHFVAGHNIPAEVLEAARQFKPDFIFTIAGSWDWTAVMARGLARELGVPLVGSFNDWFDFSLIVHPRLKPALERKFHRLYRDCDLAWCTCEGMREALGPHRNAQVLYPIGAQPKPLPERNGSRQADKFVAVFAGNLSDWYGRMMEQLVRASLKKNLPIEFRIYGGLQSWSKEFDELARAKNIFRGHLPFEKLREEMAEADCLLLLMGFDETCAHTERTSFKTKFLDYLTFRKPILLWGPEYCSASRYADEFGSAEKCNSPDPEAFLETIRKVQADPERQEQLVANADKMFQDRFHPDKIHAHFVRHSLKLLGRA
jgi:glycosyltransferase involved in cell wall biosynthesis